VVVSASSPDTVRVVVATAFCVVVRVTAGGVTLLKGKLRLFTVGVVKVRTVVVRVGTLASDVMPYAAVTQ